MRESTDMAGRLPWQQIFPLPSLPMIDEITIIEAGRRISAAAPDARVILFGSHARNEADPQSDLDLLVIEPEVKNAAMESVRLRRTLRGLAVPADVVVVDRDLARRRSAVAGTMVERALREGRVLVDA
jgi:predicted nucleotidyltransferase